MNSCEHVPYLVELVLLGSIGNLVDAVFSRMAPGERFAARAAMQTLSLQVILRSVFGLSEGERFQQLKHLIPALLDTFQSPLTTGALFFDGLRQDWGRWSPWGRFCHLRRQIDQLIYGEIRDRKANYDPDRADILNNFLPFGGGIQRCIGEALALFELKLVLATVLCRYKLGLAKLDPEP